MEIKTPDTAVAVMTSPITEEQKEALKAEESKYMIDVQLSDEDKALIDERASQIDLSSANIILEYGASSQKNIADFSDNALESVKNKDLGEVGSMISNLVTELNGFSLEEKKGFLGLFKKAPASLDKIKNQFTSAEKNVDKITSNLQSHQNQLSKDVIMLDKMYDNNLDYYKELTLYILAGKKRLEEEKAGKLVELKKKAEETGLAEDAQAANDYANLLERFEKKLYDLELTRAISIQMAPQIRLIQNSDVIMVEKIQSTITNTIPLWKNQMVLALGMAHVNQATEATSKVTDVTNDLLRKNAETLKQGTIKVAQESERSIVDIETVAETNKKLIETFDEVLRIQSEGRAKRAEAETTLGNIEAELKNKLLEIQG